MTLMSYDDDQDIGGEFWARVAIRFVVGFIVALVLMG